MITPQSYHRLFSSAEGEAVLDDLIARFDAPDVYVPGDIEATHVRIGRRQVVRFLLELLAEVNAGNLERWPKLTGR